MGTARRWSAVLIALAFVFAACGDDSTAGSTTTGGGGETTTSGEGGLTDSFRGVTADAIKLGIVYVDYECIAQYVDFNRGDQQAIAQAFVDDINDNGGVLGRQIDPVYKGYCPIDPAEAGAVCTALTDDEEVFAVLGVFIDETGQAQLCLTRDHETIHIGHELKQEWINESVQGLLLTPDITAERRVNVLMNLMKQEGTLDGRKVAILADQNTATTSAEAITSGLDDIGVEQGSTAILTIEGEDTTAAQGQLDAFIETWKGENVDTIVMSGLLVSAKQFVEKIKAAMPDVLLVSDSPSGVGAAGQDEVAAGTSPNPYEGLISADGETASEHFQSAAVQDCVAVYEAASGDTVVGPDELVAGEDGKRAEVYIAVQDFCSELHFFVTIADKVGPDLTNDNWIATVNDFGSIDLVNTSIASLHEGKYDADDAFRLISFDSSIGEQGDWKPLTELLDAS